MRLLRISCLSCFSWFLFLIPGWSLAETSTDPAWQSARAHQPPKLHLKLSLAKDHYFQGERIDAALDFSNDDTSTPWSVPVGAGEPGGVFHARDAQGVHAINPQQWCRDWFHQVVTGPVGLNQFGQYTLNLPVNETVRFDHPGVYRVYAESGVIKGTSFTASERASLVSDPVTITIDPLTPDTEQVTLADARQKIGPPSTSVSPSARNGIEQLCYLQTPASRAELIALLGQGDFVYFVRDGLYGAPDPTAESARILALVQAGKLVLDSAGTWLYADLKSYDFVKGRSPLALSEAERTPIYERLFKLREEYRQEIVAAMVKATDGQGEFHVQALWTAFETIAISKNPGGKDADGGVARRAVAAHQLELKPEQVKRLLDAWYAWGSADFLPLIQREAAPPARNLSALIALVGLRPEEAKPLVLKEFKAQTPRFLKSNYPASMLFPGIEPMPLPQLDAKLRADLNADPANPFPIIPVIECFGSRALLPDVLAAYRKYGDKWDASILKCLHLYWQRADPKGAPAVLEKP